PPNQKLQERSVYVLPLVIPNEVRDLLFLSALTSGPATTLGATLHGSRGEAFSRKDHSSFPKMRSICRRWFKSCAASKRTNSSTVCRPRFSWTPKHSTHRARGTDSNSRRLLSRSARKTPAERL